MKLFLFRRRGVLLLLLVLVLVFGGIWFYSDVLTSKPVHKQLFTKNQFVQPLPREASETRINLPVNLDEILFDSNSRIQVFNAHILGCVEGCETIAFSVKAGAKAKSAADGRVIEVKKDTKGAEVTVGYSDGLIGRHLNLQNITVTKGQKIKAGEIIGELAATIGNLPPSVEFALVDKNRKDGVEASGGEGKAVSPFDYLNSDLQTQFISLYEEKIIKAMVAENKINGLSITRWEPWLNNEILVHRENKSKIAGEWLSTKKWETGGPVDILVFLEPDHKFYTGKKAIGSDVEQKEYSIFGDYRIEYTPDKTNEKIVWGKVTIQNSDGDKIGVFKIDESVYPAKLIIDFTKTNYPTEFSNDSWTYVERTGISIYKQAKKLGVY